MTSQAEALLLDTKRPLVFGSLHRPRLRHVREHRQKPMPVDTQAVVTRHSKPQIRAKMWRSRWKFLLTIPAFRLFVFAIGAIFLAAAPLVSPLPGPGGILLFAIGLGLVLQSSAWARRRYVVLKRRYPRQAGWADWGLRRASYRRRRARKKQARDD